MKHRLNLLILCIILILPAAFIHCDEKNKDKTKNSRSSDLPAELNENLKTLGSFEAVYQAVSSSKNVMDITVISNPRLRYILVKRAVPGTPGSYMIFDFADINNCLMLIIENGECKRITLKFRDLFERLDNPVGILSCMISLSGDKAGADIEKNDYETAAPTLSLGLTKDKLNISIGFQTSGKVLSVSWLQPEEIAKAVNIIESPEYVRFVYKDNHIITVDRKTGLLFRDSWVVKPELKTPREIKLISYSAVKTDIAYSSSIPGFRDIKFTEISPEQFYREMSDKFIENIGNAFSNLDMNEFNKFIMNHSDDIIKTVRKTAREMTRNDKKTIPDKQKIAALKEKLRSAYINDMEKNPGKAGNISFNKYLDSLVLEAGSDPSGFVSPDVMMQIRTLTKKTQETINRFPEHAREPLKKLYDICMPAIAEGMMSGIIEQVIDEIKEK